MRDEPMRFRPVPATAACCLVVMLKAPARAKRRLAAEIGSRAAAAAARHLYDCMLEDVAGWEGPVCFAAAERRDLRDLALPAAPGRRLTLIQRGGNLGERLNHVDAELRAAGHTRLVFIGADCAELDQRYLHEAARALSSFDIVLGPARDGGVVLMGARVPWPALESLPWSTAELYGELRSLCERRGLTVALLAERGDIDTLADLRAARAALEHDARAARRALHAWIQRRPENDS